MRYSVEVDKDVCISSGKCVEDYPSAFAFDPDQLAETLPGITQLSDEDALTAARNCPSGAIRVLDPDGEEVDPF